MKRRLGGLVAALVLGASVARAEEPAAAPTAVEAPATPVTAPPTTETGPTDEPPVLPAPAPVEAPPPPMAAPPPPVAYSPPPWQPPPPATAPPPGPRAGKAPYVHDGFFMRLAVGPGYFGAWTDSSSDTRHFSGGTVSGEVSLGGTPGKGFVLGGSVLYGKVFALSSRDDVIDGDEPTLDGVSFSMTAVGVFGDFYPDPAGGLDFHAFLGVGGLGVTRPGVSNVDDPSGVILSGGVGYEWFVAEQLSLGVHGRVTGGSLDVIEVPGSGATTVTVIVPAVLVAGTYH